MFFNPIFGRRPWLWRLTAIMLLAMVFPLSAMAETYTVHLYAPRVGYPGFWNMKAHVEGKDDEGTLIERTTWENNELVAPSGKITVDGTDYAYYKYTFDWDIVPTRIRFNVANKNSGQYYVEYTSEYQDFVDGALYNFGSPADTPPAEFDESMVDPNPAHNHTIYFADTQNWGAANVRVHGWGENGDLSLWDYNEYVTDTGKYIKIGENYFPLYRYDFTYYNGNLTDIIFRTATASSSGKYPGDDKVVYFIENPNNTVSVDYPEELYTPTEHTVYFADTHGWWCGNTRLSITGSNGNMLNVTPTEMKQFVKIGDSDADYYPVYKYTFQYIGDLTDITFYYREKDQPQLDSNPTGYINNTVYYIESPGNHQDVASISAEGVTFCNPADVPETTHTVYYVDKANVGAANIKVHTWNGYESVTEWVNNPSMEDYNIAKIDGIKYPVYSYTFKMKGTPGKVIFRPKTNQTANLDYHEGYYYFVDGSAVESVEFVTAANYTVYFADKYFWGDAATHVHIWNRDEAGNDTGYTTWGNDPQMTDTNEYVIVDGNPYKLFKYEFKWDLEPNYIIFQHFNNKAIDLQTADDHYLDGKVYVYNPKATTWQHATVMDLGETYTVDQLPATDHTIYFLDKDNRGAENVRPHIWGNTGDVNPWYNNLADAPGMVTLGKATVDGEAYNVYMYTFKYKGTPSGLVFRYSNGNSADLTYVEGGYYKNGNSCLTDVEVEEYPTYTVYFADKYNWMANKTYVHVYSTKGGELTGWFYNDNMTDTETYVEVDGWAYPLYSYTFRWEKANAPDQIIFHTVEPTRESYSTTFEAGKVYAYSGVDKDPDYPSEVYEMGNQLTYEEVFDKYGTTVYYADTDRWGVSHTGIHLYNEGTVDENGVRHNTSEFEWGNDPRMEETGKWVRINDVWAPVYVYKTIFKDAWGMNFHAFDNPDENGNAATINRQTGDCIIQPDALYYFAGHQVKPQPKRYSEFTLYDAIPREGEEGYEKEERWIYVHLGANQKYQGGYWVEPHAHFLDRPFDVTLLKNHDYYESVLPDGRKEDQAAQYAAEKMEEVPGHPSVYRIKCDDINKVNEVVFYHFIPSRNHNNPNDPANKYEFYLEHPYFMAEHPITIDQSTDDSSNDLTTWASYVYTIGTHCVQQSYITTEEYVETWNANPKSLFVIGNNAFNPVFQADAYGDFENAININSDEDVYIVPIGAMAEDTKVRFKLSLYDVNEYTARVCGRDKISETQNRKFATFNMGCIGHDFPNDNIDSEWYWSHIINPDVSGIGSREVKTFVNETVRFNNYNQYGWRIEPGEGGVKANTPYWLVVDLHSDDVRHRSVTLIEFDPTPSLTVKSGIIEKRPMQIEDAMTLHDPDLLAGCNDNGYVYFDQVNEYSISAELHEVGSWLLEESEVEVETTDEDGNPSGVEIQTVPPLYTVEYFVYLEYDGMKIPVSKFGRADKDENGIVNISNLVYDEEAHYYLRAVYHDETNDRHFCSSYVEVTPNEVVPALIAPTVTAVDGQLITYTKKRGADESITIGGAATFDFPPLTTEDGADYPYAYFPDYMMGDIQVNNENVSSTSSLIHAEHHAASKHENFLGISAEECDILPWTPYFDNSEEYQSHHNWSNYIRNEKHVPLFIDELSTTGIGSKRIDATAEVHFAAVYPFLIHAVETDETPAEMPRRATAVGSGRYILPISKGTTAAATFAENVVISAIENVEAEADVNAPAEYFTISGQRLMSEPTAPGVYIRRCGNLVEKILVK